MRICLLLDRARLFRWHVWLVEGLAAIPGVEISRRFAPESRPLPRACDLLCHLERLVYGLRTSALDPVKEAFELPVTLEADAAARFDVVIDLAASGYPPPPCDRIVTPIFNGAAGEIGIIAAFVRKEPPAIEICDTGNLATLQIARPAPPDSDVLALTLDAVLSCAVRLIVKSLDRAPLEGRAPCRAPSPPAPALSAIAAAFRLAETVSRKLTRWLERLARGGERWAVAWRVDCGQSLLHKRSASFAVLPDDGGRYYADPFPFRHGARTFIFVEEFRFGAGRGCISVAEVDADGRAGVPRTVLEEPHHLSYPFVFAHDGEVWMIPEAGESGRVSLYRAVGFPHKWQHEAVLIDGIAGYDATLLRHRNRFWLFVCERAWHSSSWDILTLFHADVLAGVWAPHERNPVLCDAVLSRPAGATFTFNGQIVRPVQDCSQRYGGSINLCTLDRLDQTSFQQTILGRIHCGSNGCHTYNYAAGLEVIDVFGPSRRGGAVTARFSPAV